MKKKKKISYKKFFLGGPSHVISSTKSARTARQAVSIRLSLLIKHAINRRSINFQLFTAEKSNKLSRKSTHGVFRKQPETAQGTGTCAHHAKCTNIDFPEWIHVERTASQRQFSAAGTKLIVWFLKKKSRKCRWFVVEILKPKRIAAIFKFQILISLTKIQRATCFLLSSRLSTIRPSAKFQPPS